MYLKLYVYIIYRLALILVRAGHKTIMYKYSYGYIHIFIKFKNL